MPERGNILQIHKYARADSVSRGSRPTSPFFRPWLPPFLNEARILNLQVTDEHDVSAKVLRRSEEVEIVVVM
jgi:hypothetical protein